MKCYYEILEITRAADDNEIKTAYRKLALKWHPDKNIDNTEEAKEQFQLVQQAYEVLSDKQERAWYDNHREQILRGSNKEYKDDSLNVYEYFTTQCFKGYNDDENGFYTVYRTVFDKLAQEDIEYMDSKSDYDDIPLFGNSTSDYDDIVGPFYDYWSSYTTKKSYVWLDIYNINEAKNNRELKLIEKENRKVRFKAKKERNEEIRNLVAFVRKRDKRVQANVKRLEAKVAENRTKQQERRKQKLLQNKKDLEETSVAQWSKFDNVQKELEQIEKNLAAEFGEELSEHSSDESSKCEVNDLYCVVCNKVFKTQKAYENHELSKKHKENFEIIKLSMFKENLEKEMSGNDLQVNKLFCTVCDKEYKTLKAYKNHEINQKHKQNLEKQYKKSDDQSNITKSESLEDIDEIQEEPSTSSKKKNKKPNKVIRIQKLSTTEDEISEPENLQTLPQISDEESILNISKKLKKKLKSKLEPKKVEITQEENEIFSENGLEKHQTKNVIKKSQKKNIIKDINAVNLDEIDLSHCCVMCKSNFSSKNKLFEHLKKTGHSIALPEKVTKTKKKVK